MFFTCVPAESSFFVIKLKNGNSIKTDNYSVKGKKVYFYVGGGEVALPRAMINYIEKDDGFLSPGRISYIEDLILDDNTEQPVSEMSGNKAGSEIASDLNDRIDVIDSNIVNLTKNMQIHKDQKLMFIRTKEKAESRIKKMKKSSYITSKDLKERTGLEQSRIMDAESKIAETEENIKNTEKMIKNQKRIKERLAVELARQNR